MSFVYKGNIATSFINWDNSKYIFQHFWFFSVYFIFRFNVFSLFILLVCLTDGQFFYQLLIFIQERMMSYPKFKNFLYSIDNSFRNILIIRSSIFTILWTWREKLTIIVSNSLLLFTLSVMISKLLVIMWLWCLSINWVKYMEFKTV